MDTNPDQTQVAELETIKRKKGRPSRAALDPKATSFRHLAIRDYETFITNGARRMASGVMRMPMRQLIGAMPRAIESLSILRGDTQRLEVNIVHRLDRGTITARLAAALTVPVEVLSSKVLEGTAEKSCKPTKKTK